MFKLISFGIWNKKYFYIFITISFLLAYRISFGYTFDGENDYSIKFSEVLSEHYLIHQIYTHLVCIVISWFLPREKKSTNVKENAIKLNFSQRIKLTGILVKDQNLIFREKYEKDDTKNTKLFVVIIIIAYVLLEQASIIFKKFFVHMDFWMIDLFIFAFLNLKIFNIEIYRHQHMALLINSISVILNLMVVFLTIAENKEEKALYVKHWWTFFVALIIYILYSFCLSYTYINIKKLIDLKFIRIHIILAIYGVFGLLFCLAFGIIATYNNCESSISQYICIVKDNNNQTYIDNFNVYFKHFNNYDNNKDINNQIMIGQLITVFGTITYGFYKYFSFKVFEVLTPLHKIFSYPVYYFFLELIFLCVRGYNMFTDNKVNYFLISKLFVTLISEILSIFGYLLYIEIIELNIDGFKYNLKKYIMIRGDKDIIRLDSDDFMSIDDETVQDDKTISIYPDSEVYD